MNEEIKNKCEHKEFNTSVAINRITVSDEDPTVKSFRADIKIKCQDCGLPFEFIGLPAGLRESSPMVDFDRLELRAPIRPQGSVIDQVAKRQFEKHIVGELNGTKQMCIMCGETIVDYTNTAWPADQEPPKGFPEGPVFVSEGQPKVYCIELPADHECKNCTS